MTVFANAVQAGNGDVAVQGSPWAGIALTPGLQTLLGELPPAPPPQPLNDALAGDTLVGTWGADVLTGGPGNDIIEGGPGADTINGGSGINTAVFRLGRDWAQGVAFDGSSVIPGQIAIIDDHGGHARTLTHIQNLTIYGRTTGAILDDMITGGSGNDTIYGGPGNDIIHTGKGITTIYSGSGDNTIYINNPFDRIIEPAGQGYDTVIASVPYALPPNVRALYLEPGVTSGSGNNAGDLIVGSSSSCILRGGAGNDQIYGGAGNDWLQGGPGVNYLDGGGGVNGAIWHLDSDWQQGKPFNASAVGAGPGSVVIDGGSGSVDTLVNIQRVQVIGFLNQPNDITGGQGQDILIGGNAGNVIRSGPGATVMQGGSGTDTFYVNNVADLVREPAANPNATIIASVSFHLPPNVDKLVLTGNAYAGTGNADYDTITASDNGCYLRAGSGGATLIGGAGSDTLIGGAGTNVLDGGFGADTLTGGSGPNTFIEREGQAQGDTISNFHSGHDHLELAGWSAGSTLTLTDPANHSYTITDALSGHAETLTILGDPVARGDLIFG